MSSQHRRPDSIVDSERRGLFPSKQARLETRWLPGQNRLNTCKDRMQSQGTRPWVRRLFLISIMAALSSTREGSAPIVCEAFVTPTRKRTIANQLDYKRMKTSENRWKEHAIGSMSRRIYQPIRPPTSSVAANGSASHDNMSRKTNNSNESKIAGFLLAVAIILSLAGTLSGPTSDDTVKSVAVMNKVVQNTVPTTSTEVVAVTLGESIGGVIGAIFSVAINFVLRGGKANDGSSKSSGRNDKNKKSLLSQGLADSDYFIANSASNSLLEAVGVPETVAKYSSVFIAAVPSQLVKVVPRLTQREMPLPVPDEPQQTSNPKPNAIQPFWNKSKNKNIENSKKIVPAAVAAATAAEAASSTTSLTTEAAAVSAVDFVEVFADVTRWLEYDVLKTEYGETALSQLWMVGNNLSAINPLQSAITFALLGSLAAVSSRWYADVLYGRFRYGPIEKQREVRRRNSAEWFSIYSSTAASAAALFGCYEFFQLPIGRYIQGTLSGGVEGCFGSSSFDACMQTFINTNAPGPSTEAQFRALATNLYAVYIRLQDIAGDTTWDDIAALIRAWAVSLASYMANM